MVFGSFVKLYRGTALHSAKCSLGDCEDARCESPFRQLCSSSRNAETQSATREGHLPHSKSGWFHSRGTLQPNMSGWTPRLSRLSSDLVGGPRYLSIYRRSPELPAQHESSENETMVARNRTDRVDKRGTQICYRAVMEPRVRSRSIIVDARGASVIRVDLRRFPTEVEAVLGVAWRH